MIVFDLRCLSQGHVFEAWFGSSADYEEQKERGLLSCPLCGTAEVAKAMMAPRVAAKGNGEPPPQLPEGAPDAAQVKAMLAELAVVQKKLLENSSFVGDRFADEARAIHLGEAEARAIHGRATRAQVESLTEEGIRVAPLPLPLPEAGEAN